MEHGGEVPGARRTHRALDNAGGWRRTRRWVAQRPLHAAHCTHTSIVGGAPPQSPQTPAGCGARPVQGGQWSRQLPSRTVNTRCSPASLVQFPNLGYCDAWQGSWVWYNHESETWLPAKVTEGGSGTISVELEDTFGENAAAGMVCLSASDPTPLLFLRSPPPTPLPCMFS